MRNVTTGRAFRCSVVNFEERVLFPLSDARALAHDKYSVKYRSGVVCVHRTSRVFGGVGVYVTCLTVGWGRMI